MKFRLAAPGDLPAFDAMLRLYLIEHTGEPASRVLLTPRTVDYHRNLARYYLAGNLFGIVTLAEEAEAPVGFALIGEETGRVALDTRWGKAASVWAAWVTPALRQAGVALSMLSFSRDRLLEMGFEVVFMSVVEANKAGQALSLAFGAVPLERVYYYPLKERPAHELLRQSRKV